MGGRIGDPDKSIDGFKEGEKITCYSFAHPQALMERTKLTMGMQMINDPCDNVDNEENRAMVNADMKFDKFIVATKDIDNGQEIFLRYNRDGPVQPPPSQNHDNNTGGDSDESNKSDSSDSSDNSEEFDENYDEEDDEEEE